jgi:SAM-dependent methyltransferase
MKPYERGISRVHAMYRVPSPPRRTRMLELCFGAPSILTGFSWPGEFAVTCVLQNGSLPVSTETLGNAEHAQCVADYRKALPFAARSFDLVIVHESLDRLIGADHALENAQATIELIGRIRDVLVDDGVLAGSVGNRASFSRWGNLFKTSHAEGDASPAATFTIRSCRDVLARSGFSSVQTFNVLPGAQSPSRLINTDADLSRLGFRRELEAIRPSLSLPGYVARRTLVELALNRFFEESIFFWGRRK